MLSDIERLEIEKAVKHYPDKQAGAIDALLLLQRRRGWISDESLLDIAQFLGMTREDVDGVATFYNRIFRQPVGRHVLFLCDSISCWIMGCEQVRNQLSSRYGVEMGQTTGDDRFTILPIACLGHCERAPAIMIDDDVYGNVTPDKIERIVEKYK
ncbi:NADH-quinone oxidoreductase subunit NuoE [Nitrospira sp. BLG_2]|uniref:NADH-quinone oxidoreductase subunit NuoE n=1 Tax=Nitrospira sp. BLG_2 TaxID=3397507 RepID=UPI003B991591